MSVLLHLPRTYMSARENHCNTQIRTGNDSPFFPLSLSLHVNQSLLFPRRPDRPSDKQIELSEG